MINYHYETSFEFQYPMESIEWINDVILAEGSVLGDLNYIFCDDKYLIKLNKDYLNHDTYTDTITFDYTVGKELQGDIYISVERVAENADQYGCTFGNELARVMVHGVLHLIGYMDKSPVDRTIMRGKEDFYLAQFAALNP